MNIIRKEHWEHVYATKQPHEVSWTQAIPQTSLDLIHSFNLPKSAAIIDIGGGDSRLADFLLDEGYEDITVLDISAIALEKAKQRLGDKAAKIKWIVADITEFEPDRQYDVWHDRAVFHFLTTAEQVAQYKAIVDKAAKGYLIIGTFAEDGPTKCSGLEVHQYSAVQLAGTFSRSFEKINCKAEDHTTPFHTIQHFTFCSFRARVA